MIQAGRPVGYQQIHKVLGNIWGLPAQSNHPHLQDNIKAMHKLQRDCIILTLLHENHESENRGKWRTNKQKITSFWKQHLHSWFHLYGSLVERNEETEAYHNIYGTLTPPETWCSQFVVSLDNSNWTTT